MAKGRIIKALSGFYYVQTEEGLLTCRARGKFRKEGISPLVGDWAEVRPLGNQEGFVEAILPRRNAFDRPAVANIDQLVVIGSGAIPKTDPFLIDRVASIAALKGCDVIVVLNKCDLDSADNLYDLYRAAGFQTLRVSAETGEGIEELKPLISGKLSAFTGNSGVGKSSILNALDPTFHIQVGEVSTAHHPPCGALSSGLRGRCGGLPRLFLLRDRCAEPGTQGPFAGDLPGVCAVSGQVPLCGVQPY